MGVKWSKINSLTRSEYEEYKKTFSFRVAISPPNTAWYGTSLPNNSTLIVTLSSYVINSREFLFFIYLFFNKIGHHHNSTCELKLIFLILTNRAFHIDALRYIVGLDLMIFKRIFYVFKLYECNRS